MTRSEHRTEADLEAVAAEVGVDARDDTDTPEDARSARDAARERVEADERSSHARGVRMTPSFFINGRHYYGSWDEARSEAHTSELQSLMRISYSVFCFKHNTPRPSTLLRSTHILFHRLSYTSLTSL